ncbi:50S ribosomal protein L25 [Paenibacillus alvei]|uniref:50S ribosomal protein L25 n=1 Tax=Paenibacillus alvei TaxID=44250 RepID=A0ABT4H2C2_PAEAL|nr:MULTISPECIES: 50S ribosomal protein L25 [Paenibacillus]EJW14190.1 ribosomal protein L25 (general stress protein Ctc) [Paenibacillus alvei DSM 29]MCY7486022.1 50S ribosomal protein L25 [Paenibacillus alvei]MCY9540028.1 50S ribosomal protein L25 [Paenibacillus alvei]MCY9705522.1 50S ribosomal protein L25 [Paenibacillus alvei]MCY9735761.1 50S ribosomal protein L25 [Paenibacillus alvei]
MMQQFQAVTRNIEKRSEVRQLRSEGRIPCVLLQQQASVNLHMDAKAFALWVRDAAHNQLELSIDGANPITAQVQEIQRHPVTNDILHVDLLACQSTALA